MSAGGLMGHQTGMLCRKGKRRQRQTSRKDAGAMQGEVSG
ncbi:hypothetical protein C8C92_2121 [Janthinobacterium sp. 78]|nr:hypothetical protein C8C92_2121 [Janthinobacterium sp. 78]